MSQGIVWTLCIGFVGGVGARSLVPEAWPFTPLILLVGVLGLVYQYIDISRRNLCIYVAVVCVSFVGGAWRMDAAALRDDPLLTERVETKVVVEGYVFAEPDRRERNTRVSLHADTLEVASSSVAIDARVLVVAPLHSPVAYGDRIRAEGVLTFPQAFESGEGRAFDYPLFLAKDGIVYQLAFAEIQNLGQSEGYAVKKVALWVKQTYLDGLHRALPEPESGLAGGITVGDKRSIGQKLTEVFQTVSLVHIIVLSGYNMTVVINAAQSVSGFLPRTGKFAVSGAIVALFVLMTGGASSAVRAGSMALVAAFARITGRSYLALRVLAVVAFAMVLWNPFVLAFDPGFQLSVVATLGLVLFTPLISARIVWMPEKYGLREIAASTIGTQIAVLPLLLYQNGLLSIVSLPANMLALVVVPFAMFFSFVASLAGLVLGSFAGILAFPAYVLLKYVIAVAHTFASLPFASVAVPAFSAWVLALMYAVMALLYLRIKKTSGGA